VQVTYELYTVANVRSLPQCKQLSKLEPKQIGLYEEHGILHHHKCHTTCLSYISPHLEKCSMYLGNRQNFIFLGKITTLNSIP